MSGLRNLSDAAARKAAERNAALTPQAKMKRFLGGIGSGCAWLWRSTPTAVRATVLFVVYCLAIGFLGVMTYWEVTNAGSGYSLIFAGWGGVAYLAGASIAGFYMWSHRQHKETGRAIEELEDAESKALELQSMALAADARKKAKKLKQRANRWRFVSILCACITLFGVFSNLVSHASMDTAHAIEVEQDRGELRREISRLRRELGALPKPQGVEFTRETLDSYLAEAAGWKLPNLDAAAPESAPEGYPGPACVANFPRSRPRELCNLAADIRAELKEADEMQAAVVAKQDEIAQAEAKLEAKQPVSGAAHYQAMAKLVLSVPGVPADWEEAGIAGAIQVWGVLFLAIAGLYVCAIGWDGLGEALDGRGRKKPTDPTAPATGV